MNENVRFFVLGFFTAIVLYAIYEGIMSRVEVALIKGSQGEFLTATHIDTKEKEL